MCIFYTLIQSPTQFTHFVQIWEEISPSLCKQLRLWSSLICDLVAAAAAISAKKIHCSISLQLVETQPRLCHLIC
jgi:hypothetical protein